MPKTMRYYYHQANYHRSQRFTRRLKHLVIGTSLLVFLSAAVIGFDYVWENLEQSGQKTVTTATSGYYSAPVKVFRSPFFQFQTDNSWSEVTNESQPNVYLYRRARQQFIDHELIIYVNKPQPNLTATRVLPVNLTSSGELLPLKVSKHCSETFKDKEPKSIKIVAVEDVRVLCDPHDPAYNVMLGVQEGGTELKLPRPDKSTVTLIIVYKNLTALPEGSQIEQIAETFQTR